MTLERAKLSVCMVLVVLCERLNGVIQSSSFAHSLASKPSSFMPLKVSPVAFFSFSNRSIIHDSVKSLHPGDVKQPSISAAPSWCCRDGRLCWITGCNHVIS